VANINTVGGCFVAIITGVLIHWTGTYKWLALLAVPMQILGSGLMIYFRQPNTNIGYVVMCQIFVALSSGTLVVCVEMAVMAVAQHGQIAALIALISLAANIGGAVGSAVSGAIWTNTLPRYLALYLPESAQGELDAIYGSLDVQLSHAVGGEVRNAIVRAYGVAQQRMCIAGTSVLVSNLAWVYMWKNVRVSEVEQVKGTVW